MGKKKGDENPKPNAEKEGHNLLGAPTFKKLDNGRFKCKQTGHELPAHARDSYAKSKHCRLGLIDFFLARNKPPLNMFQQDPASRSKLICRLTGFVINKTEEHIWKHINGKRFLNMLDKKEAEKEDSNGTVGEKEEKTKKKNEDGGLKKKKKKMIMKEEKLVDEIMDVVRDMENEADFWMPPVRERWDHDDGGDRWGSDSESDSESDDGGEGAEEAKHEAGELSKTSKRTSVEIGPSRLASRKKKKKTNVE